VCRKKEGPILPWGKKGKNGRTNAGGEGRKTGGKRREMCSEKIKLDKGDDHGEKTLLLGSEIR